VIGERNARYGAVVKLQMSPSQVMNARSRCVIYCRVRLPATADYREDFVSRPAKSVKHYRGYRAGQCVDKEVASTYWRMDQIFDCDCSNDAAADAMCRAVSTPLSLPKRFFKPGIIALYSFLLVW
jgi:hypothetical protein